MQRTALLILVSALFALPAAAQQPAATGPSDEQLLQMYDGLRVADVVDGMDVVGLRSSADGHAHPGALEGHRGAGPHRPGDRPDGALRAPQQVVPNPLPEGQFGAWEGKWYNELSPEPFVEMIRPGSIIVIDASGNGDTGTVGSFNALDWVARGARGVVTTGSVRDTDEVIKQKIPVYLDPLQRGRGIRPGRNMVESVNRPVEVGGALVRPGDVIVADGDGVVVVPREHPPRVAREARAVLDKDKEARRRLYERLGRPLDQTVKE